MPAQPCTVMEPCQGRELRLCKISYRSAAAAALTPSDSILPSNGSVISWSHALLTRGRRPAPSLPSTRTTPSRDSRHVVGHRFIRAGADARAVAPASGLAGIRQEVREVAHAHHRQELDRSGRGLAHRRGHFGGPPFRDHHPMLRRTRRYGRSSRGSEDPVPGRAPLSAGFRPRAARRRRVAVGPASRTDP